MSVAISEFIRAQSDELTISLGCWGFSAAWKAATLKASEDGRIDGLEVGTLVGASEGGT